MNEYVKRYSKIVNDLIKKSFPKLRDGNIRIFEIPEFLVWWVTGFVFSKFIIVTRRLRKFDKKSQIGLFAHELCHVEDSQKRPFLLEFFYFMKENLSWLFFTSSSRNVERETDLRVIRKGYARELYHFEVMSERKFSKKRLSKISAGGYLSSSQVKKYAKKIGKW